MITPKVFTVSQLNARVASLIAADEELQTIFIEGELSNVSFNAKSGHLYFSLKDKDSVIRAVMFSWAFRTLRFRPEDGMKVIMRASVTVYEPAGQYQLRVEDMQPDGVGVLAMQLEQLKKKLGAEGLFSEEHKKPIPDMPRTVGVITSPTGAALRDICDIIGRRFPCAEIVLAPVLVQGEGAPAQLINAVRLFSDSNAADVIIIGRGGGSMEDLWAFNDEGLARAIYDCKVPVISAVGHETDTTVCDFVSDLRAPTPSAAAELAVPDRTELSQIIVNEFKGGLSSLENKIGLRQKELDHLAQLTAARSPLPAVEKDIQLLAQLSLRASRAAENAFNTAVARTQELASRVEALSPAAVLNRGFAYLMKDGVNVRSAKELISGDKVSVTMADGTLSATVD